MMKLFHVTNRWRNWAISGLLLVAGGATATLGMNQKPTSYAPVDNREDVASVIARMKAAKPAIMQRQMDLLKERYDLSNRPAEGVTMSRGKPVQEGVRVKLPTGVTWEQLNVMTPADIRTKALFPAGFY
ncbi:cytochrome B6, partial [Planctomycetota bacterium]